MQCVYELCNIVIVVLLCVAPHAGGAAHAVQLHVPLVGIRPREQPGEHRPLLHLSEVGTHERPPGKHPKDNLQQPGHRRGHLDEETGR